MIIGNRKLSREFSFYPYLVWNCYSTQPIASFWDYFVWGETVWEWGYAEPWCLSQAYSLRVIKFWTLWSIKQSTSGVIFFQPVIQTSFREKDIHSPCCIVSLHCSNASPQWRSRPDSSQACSVSVFMRSGNTTLPWGHYFKHSLVPS